MKRSRKLVLRLRLLRKIYGELLGLEPSPQTSHINIDGHDVVEVTFTDEQARLIVERAISKAKPALEQAGTFGPTNYESTIRTNKVGFLGQVAWYIYAEDDFPKGLSTLKFGFHKDEQDFIFKGYKGDVKCAGRANAELMMTPEHRFQKRHFDLYVGCRLIKENPYIVQIWGYASREDLEKYGYIDDFGYGLTRCYRLKNLHAIIELRNLKAKVENRKE